ncbi:uncharacterized protein LOC135211934 isoform X4 [Macrobrachium nipponense]|uniref:uncharacterized protein LOC135211934 isoform X4 n=1 Tax=Macrobrachium nipponense TaxID=159736 RepID=UPI0030C7A241
MTNNIRRLISIIWLWTLCVGDIMEEKLIRYESTTDIEGLAVTTRECGNDDPTNKAVVRLEIDCDENILSIRNEVNALRESIKKDVYTIAQSLQTCSSDIISDIISKLLSKDECAGTNNCSANADCIDGVLSYRCNCRPGYQGDGFTCSDIACGSPAKLIEGLGCVIPVEERMIWTRARDYCHRLGYRLLEGITNTDQLNQLKEHFDRGVFSFPQSIHDVWLRNQRQKWVEGPNTQVPNLTCGTEVSLINRIPVGMLLCRYRPLHSGITSVLRIQYPSFVRQCLSEETLVSVPLHLASWGIVIF